MEPIHLIQSIQNRIYEMRGQRVMLDKDLAVLYGVEVKVLNQAVKRNLKRFPEDFMFQLTVDEYAAVQSQVRATEESDISSRSQIVTLNVGRGHNLKYLPHAFTEQGVAMLSGVLKSNRAIEMNIAIMRAFVELRRVLMMEGGLQHQLREIKERIGEHDTTLKVIYEAIENLLDEGAARRNWEDRERIGFKTGK